MALVLEVCKNIINEMMLLVMKTINGNLSKCLPLFKSLRQYQAFHFGQKELRTAEILSFLWYILLDNWRCRLKDISCGEFQ